MPIKILYISANHVSRQTDQPTSKWLASTVYRHVATPRVGNEKDSGIVAMDRASLPAPINPLVAVRRTTAEVMGRAVHVSLNSNAVEQLATVWAVEGEVGAGGVGK